MSAYGRQILRAVEGQLFHYNKGRAWWAGGQISLGSGAEGNAHLLNPADSGKLLHIFSLSVWTDLSQALVQFLEGGTSSNAIRDASQANRVFKGQTDPVGILRVGTTALGGTPTLLSAMAQVAVSAPYVFDDLATLPPGDSLAIRMVAPGGITGSAIYRISVGWFWTPI